MKAVLLALLCVGSVAPLYADSGDHIVPAGSLIQCTVSERKISSKTTAVGDPVLCQVGRTEGAGGFAVPQNAYLEGRFEDYKDPGHFVGKGWMELKFDRMVIEPNTVIPVEARVVDVPGYKVDDHGHIVGKGHAKRDAVMWSIPILWPVDMVTLPMRGPRPTLKDDTQLTLKVMNDLDVPWTGPMQSNSPRLAERQPMAQNAAPPPYQGQFPDQGQYPDQGQGQYQGPGPMGGDYGQAAPVAPPPPAYYGYDVPAPPPTYYAYGGPPVLGFGFGAPFIRGYGYGYGRPAIRGYGYGGFPGGRYGYGAGGARMGRGYGGAPRGGMAMRGGGGRGGAMRGGGGGRGATRGGGGRGGGRR